MACEGVSAAKGRRGRARVDLAKNSPKLLARSQLSDTNHVGISSHNNSPFLAFLFQVEAPRATRIGSVMFFSGIILRRT